MAPPFFRNGEGNLMAKIRRRLPLLYRYLPVSIFLRLHKPRERLVGPLNRAGHLMMPRRQICRTFIGYFEDRE